MRGEIYIVSALILGSYFLYKVLILMFAEHEKAAISTFVYSINYLMLLFIAMVLDMLDAFSAREDVVGDVEHVIRFVIRQMDFEQVQIPVDRLNQSRPLGQRVHRPDPARSQAPNPVGQFVLNGARREHRSVLRGPGTWGQPIQDFPLASLELLASTIAHSKCLLAKRVAVGSIPLLSYQQRHFEYFFCIHP